MRAHRSSIGLCALLSVVLLLPAHAAFAQNAAIGGTSTDPQTAVIGGAEVVLLSGRREVRAVRTDDRGRYRFDDAVPAGAYGIEVRAGGFRNAQVPIQISAPRSEPDPDPDPEADPDS